MINIQQFIAEKLKVSSSANVSKIDFDMFAEALYNYYTNTHKEFELEYLDYYKDLPGGAFPHFENNHFMLTTKGYIRKLAADTFKSEYRILLFYTESPDKDRALSVITIRKEHFDVLTNAIEPKILKEIYDYLIDNA